MSKEETVDLQIRGMPWALREKLRRHAKGKGLSLSRYIVERLSEHLSRPTLEEWREDLARAQREQRALAAPERRRGKPR